MNTASVCQSFPPAEVVVVFPRERRPVIRAAEAMTEFGPGLRGRGTLRMLTVAGHMRGIPLAAVLVSWSAAALMPQWIALSAMNRSHPASQSGVPSP
jgi:hypothetical protein